MTYTLLAIDPEARLIGAATASYSLAVGNAVIAIAPDVGAVASQAYTNRSLRSRSIAALRSGHRPGEVIARLPQWDDRHDWRQVAVLSRDGTAAAHTGRRCSAWAGSLTGPNLVVCGNLLADAAVLTAMRDGFTAADEPDQDGPVAGFARRLLTALTAGQHAGGDRRGRQSAALLVHPMADTTDWPPDPAVDLRSDNHPDPLADLANSLTLQFAAE